MSALASGSAHVGSSHADQQSSLLAPENRSWRPAERSDRIHQPPPSLETPQKRVKVSRACDACRSKKKRCSGQLPCTHCHRLRAQCTYEASYARGRVLSFSPTRSASVVATQHSLDLPIAENDPSRVVNPRASQHPHHERPSLLSRDVEAVGGSTCPPSRRMSPEPAAATNVDGNYHGPTSAHSFLGKAWRRFDRGRVQPTLSSPLEDGSLEKKSIFSFGDRSIPEVDVSEFSWPTPAAARELLQRYFDFSAPTYRVLHRPTVAGWLSYLQEEQLSEGCSPLSLPEAVQAAVLMVFATASMFKLDMNGAMCDADALGWRESELYYAVAQKLLNGETGPQRLESVQARFMTVLYLLSSSRANQAWFNHGVTVQLIMALGLHRKRPPAFDGTACDNIDSECQKRVLWCSYTVDKYLSIIIGRPRLLQDEDIDQAYPSHVNDEDLSAQVINARPARDCTMDAPIFHARLARILARASKEQYAIQQLSDQQQIDASSARSEDIARWHEKLPPFISGAVQAGTLMPVFRRQLTVLRLAHYHAIMFVTRPLLLRNYAKKLDSSYGTRYRHRLRECVLAAKDAADLILAFVQDGQLFPAFWYSQYIAFNALSIIYIYLIQAMKHRIPSQILGAIDEHPIVIGDRALLQLAISAQNHLAKATIRNAPAWKYSVILDGLRSEVAGSGEVTRTQNSLPGHQHGKLSTTDNTWQIGAPAGQASSTVTQQPRANSLSPFAGQVPVVGSNQCSVSTFGPDPYAGTLLRTADAMFSSSSLLDFPAEQLFEGSVSDMGDEEFGFEFWTQFDSLPLILDPHAIDNMT
ncbi:hypothetical protein LTR95_006093 [Oleoguttula sp. CCFEE 5521]